MSTPILARADKLMRRRRSRSADLDDVPVLVDAIDLETDIPLLVDAEPAITVPEPHTKMEPATAPEFFPVLDQAILDMIVNELARRVHDRFAAELPAIIEGTVRDFLAEPDIVALIQARD